MAFTESLDRERAASLARRGPDDGVSPQPPTLTANQVTAEVVAVTHPGLASDTADLAVACQGTRRFFDASEALLQAWERIGAELHGDPAIAAYVAAIADSFGPHLPIAAAVPSSALSRALCDARNVLETTTVAVAASVATIWERLRGVVELDADGVEDLRADMRAWRHQVRRQAVGVEHAVLQVRDVLGAWAPVALQGAVGPLIDVGDEGRDPAALGAPASRAASQPLSLVSVRQWVDMALAGSVSSAATPAVAAWAALTVALEGPKSSKDKDIRRWARGVVGGLGEVPYAEARDAVRKLVREALATDDDRAVLIDDVQRLVRGACADVVREELEQRGERSWPGSTTLWERTLRELSRTVV